MSTTLSAIDQKTNTAETRSKLLAPKLRFKEFEREWENKTMGELGSFIGGGTPNTNVEKYWIGDIPWISSSDLFEDDLHNINIHRFLNKEAVSESATKLIPKNSVLLISRVGVGKIAINKIELCTSQDFSNFIPKQCESYFIGYFLLARKNQVINFAQGTSIKGFTTSDIKSLKVTIPSLPEQQKIASYLSAVDEKIQQLTRKKELLEQYKKGVMQNLFSGKLRFKDENGGDFPDWEMVGGNKLFDSISDKKHNSDLPILAITQDQGAIPRDLINYQMSVTDSSIASYKVVQVGDFIISLRTFQGGIEYSNYKGICSPAYNILRPNSENVHRDFYRYYLKTEYYIKQLQKNLEGIRDGKMISYKYFSEIKLPYPSVKEQQKIASYLSAIDTKIESVTNQITQTQTYKKGLLQQMFV